MRRMPPEVTEALTYLFEACHAHCASIWIFPYEYETWVCCIEDQWDRAFEWSGPSYAQAITAAARGLPHVDLWDGTAMMRSRRDADIAWTYAPGGRIPVALENNPEFNVSLDDEEREF